MQHLHARLAERWSVTPVQVCDILDHWEDDDVGIPPRGTYATFAITVPPYTVRFEAPYEWPAGVPTSVEAKFRSHDSQDPAAWVVVGDRSYRRAIEQLGFSGSGEWRAKWGLGEQTEPTLERINDAINGLAVAPTMILRPGDVPNGVPWPGVYLISDVVAADRITVGDNDTSGKATIAVEEDGRTSNLIISLDAMRFVQWWQDRGRTSVSTGTPSAKGPPAKAPLILVGNFREMGYADEADAPSLHHVRRKRPHGHKTDVVAYLRKAKSVSFSPGYETSIFDPKTFVGTHTMRTDGVYVWPDFLAGYVEHEDVALPEQFERHMAERNWQLPDNLDTKTLTPPW